MVKPATSNVKRAETHSLNTKINKEVFDNFRDYCAYRGYPMNVLIEIFMKQYSSKKFNFDNKEIDKWAKDNSETNNLNTTFNKEIYLDFKNYCKYNDYYMKDVITAFMDKVVNCNYIIEFVELKENK